MSLEGICCPTHILSLFLRLGHIVMASELQAGGHGQQHILTVQLKAAVHKEVKSLYHSTA